MSADGKLSTIPREDAPVVSTAREFEDYAALVAIAHKYPRDEAAVLKDLLVELRAAPEEASRSWYSIPYKDNASGRTVKVEGLSYYAATTIARRWGNNTIGAHLLNEDDDGWDLIGYFIDFQQNVRIARPFRGSKWEKRRGQTGAIKLDVQRELQAFQSNVSKAVRNAALAGIPAYLKTKYWQEARLLAAGGVKIDSPADPKSVALCVEAFAKWKVTQAHLEAYVEKPRADWLAGDLADLRGVWNAIADGQTTVDDAFGSVETAPAPPPGSTTMDPGQVTGGQVSAANDVRPGDPTPPGPGPAAPAPPAATSSEPPQDGQKRRRTSRRAEPDAPPAQAAAAPPEGQPAAPAPAHAPAPAPAPAPTPTTSSGGLPPAEFGAELSKINDIGSGEDLDVHVGALYSPGGPISRASADQRKAMLRAISDRRNSL